MSIYDVFSGGSKPYDKAEWAAQKQAQRQEAYMKWNVYIGRKKERTASGRNSDAEHGNRAEGNRAYDARDRRNRDSREKRDMTDRRGNNNRGRHER